MQLKNQKRDKEHFKNYAFQIKIFNGRTEIDTDEN